MKNIRFVIAFIVFSQFAFGLNILLKEETKIDDSTLKAIYKDYTAGKPNDFSPAPAPQKSYVQASTSSNSPMQNQFFVGAEGMFGHAVTSKLINSLGERSALITNNDGIGYGLNLGYSLGWFDAFVDVNKNYWLSLDGGLGMRLQIFELVYPYVEGRAGFASLTSYYGFNTSARAGIGFLLFSAIELKVGYEMGWVFWDDKLEGVVSRFDSTGFVTDLNYRF